MQIDATPTAFATDSTSAARADAALRSPFSFSSAAMRSSIVGSGFTYAKKPPVRMALINCVWLGRRDSNPHGPAPASL